VLENAHYSADLAPCDFFLFPKIKSALKGSRFGSMDVVKVNMAELLHSLTPNNFIFHARPLSYLFFTIACREGF